MPASRPVRPAPARERSRARILAAATRLIAEGGVESLSFGAVARAAGVSRPLVYFHFKDREHLFLEAALRANRILQARFIDAVAAQRRGLDQMIAIGRAYQSFFEKNPREFALMSCYESKPAGRARPDALQQEVLECDNAIMGLMTEVLARGIRDGSMRRDAGDPLRTALCLWAFTHGLLQVSATHGRGIEEAHGIRPRALVDFGFRLLRGMIERRR